MMVPAITVEMIQVTMAGALSMWNFLPLLDC
jgi:hypothetical protein